MPLKQLLWILFTASMTLFPAGGQATESLKEPATVCLGRTGKTPEAIRLCAPPGPRFALVVGQIDYAPHHQFVGQVWSRLEIAGRDADALADQLMLNGFELVGKKAQHDLTRTAFLESLEQLAELGRGRNATLLVYVSGHGFTHRSRTLVAPIEAPRPIVGIPIESEDHISVADIERVLERSTPRLQIILLDACRDALPSIDPVLGEQDPIGPQTVLGLAAAPGNTVDVLHDAKTSAYSGALLDGLSSSDLDLTLTRFFLNVGMAVRGLTADEQTPVFRYGSPQLHGLLNARAVFAGAPNTLAPTAQVTFDRQFETRFLSTFDFALACDRTESGRRETGVPIEVRQFYGLALLAAANDADRNASCARIQQDISRFDGSPVKIDERFGSYAARNSIGLVLQIAQSGNAHANWIFFLYSLRDATEILFTREMLRGYLPPERRTALEYLYRAADGGEPMAQLFLGQQSMPGENENKYYAILPGSADENFERGRIYLERALAAGIGDAGLILARNARRNLRQLNTHPDKFRSYVESALASRILLFPPSYLLTIRFLLAEDYLDGRTGTPSLMKGMTMMRAIADTRLIDASADISYPGLAAWRLVFLWVTSKAAPPHGMTRNLAIYTYTKRAMDLGVKEALDFGGDAYAIGRFGFPKDPASADESKRLAAESKMVSRYSVTLTLSPSP